MNYIQQTKMYKIHIINFPVTKTSDSLKYYSLCWDSLLPTFTVKYCKVLNMVYLPEQGATEAGCITKN